MRTPAVVADMVPSVMRIHRRLRTLNGAYTKSENKRETIAVLQACVSELAVAHSLLPSELRGKSWVLTLERHPA